MVDTVDCASQTKVDASVSSVDDHHRGIHILFGMEQQLATLSEAFAMTGNKHMADILYALADRAEEARNLMSSAFGLQLSERLRDTQESTFNMIAAALGGLAVGARDAMRADEKGE